jgi:hypothetical protein
MDNNLENALDDFMGGDSMLTSSEKNGKKRKEVVLQNHSLIERVDKVFVTEDGRQLLREQEREQY